MHFKNIPNFEIWYIHTPFGNTVAGQFSGGKEIKERWYHYERIALLILIDKSLGQSPARKS